MKVSLEKAEEIVRANTPVLDTERLPLMLCMGKILARDVAAAISQPPFRRSAMDGYAVRREDWGQDAVSRRLPFKVIGEIHAGCQSVPELGAYEAARIMTGGEGPGQRRGGYPPGTVGYGGGLCGVSRIFRCRQYCAGGGGL